MRWNAITSVVSILVILLTAIVPVYVAYDIYRRGPTPEVRLELQQFGAIDPLNDVGLSGMADKVELQLKFEDQTVDNIQLSTSTLKNVGRAPIEPSAYHENISVNVEPPWKIVTVTTHELFAPELRLQWRRISDTRFEADPALINPGDWISTVIYLTNTEYDPSIPLSEQPKPNVEWRARITNMRAFHRPPDLTDIQAERRGRVSINLTGWSLWYTIAVALLFQAFYLYLLSNSGVVMNWSWPAIGIVVCSSLLSWGAAEASATYLFGSYITDIFGIDPWLNVTPIVLHIIALIYLYWRMRKRQKATSG